jgi:hypothetical protein
MRKPYQKSLHQEQILDCQQLLECKLPFSFNKDEETISEVTASGTDSGLSAIVGVQTTFLFQ